MILAINLAALTLGLSVLGLGLRLLRYTSTKRSEALTQVAMACAAGAAALALALFAVAILGVLSPIVLFVLAVVLCVQAVPELRRLWQERLSTLMAGTAVGVPMIVLAFLVATVWLFQNVPPIFFDTLVYHLGLPQQYLIRGGLVQLPNFHYSAMPANAELFYALGLALGDIPFARLIGFGGLVFGLLQVASLANYWQERSGALAAVLALGLPITMFMGIHNGVDHWVALFLCASVLASLHWIDSGRLSDAGWAGVFAGAAIGCKYTALYHVAPLAIVVLIARARRSGEVLAMLRSVGTGALATLAVGGGWYLRNAINTGNPVYPAFFGMFGGDGWSAAAAERLAQDAPQGGAGQLTLIGALQIPWDLVINPQNFGEFGDVGLLFWGLLFVGTVGGLRRSGTMFLWMVLVVPFWMMTALHLRYLLPVLWVLAALAGAETQRLIAFHPGVWRRRVAELAIVILAVTGIGAVVRKETQVFHAHDYLLGRLLHDRYLQLGTDYYDVARMTADLPEDSHVLLVGDSRLLFYERPVLASSAYDENLGLDSSGKGARSKAPSAN